MAIVLLAAIILIRCLSIYCSTQRREQEKNMDGEMVLEMGTKKGVSASSLDPLLALPYSILFNHSS